MGIIRKTLSISTLGIVSFRSKKELLRRAEKDRRAAEAELGREHAGRRARKAAKAARHTAEAARDRAGSIEDDIVDLTTTAAAEVEERADAARAGD